MGHATGMGGGDWCYSLLRSLHGLPAVRPCRRSGAFRVCEVTSDVSRETMKVPPVDKSTESRSLASPLGRGIRKDPGRAQLCGTRILTPDIPGIVCVRGRLPRTIDFKW